MQKEPGTAEAHGEDAEIVVETWQSPEKGFKLPQINKITLRARAALPPVVEELIWEAARRLQVVRCSILPIELEAKQDHFSWRIKITLTNSRPTEWIYEHDVDLPGDLSGLHKLRLMLVRDCSGREENFETWTLFLEQEGTLTAGQ